MKREHAKGTCIGCASVFNLEGRKVPEHDISTSYAGGRCGGSARLSKEAYTERKDKARTKRETHVASRVGDASVMLDALIHGRADLDEQLVGLRKTATTKLRLQYANSNAAYGGFSIARRTDGRRDVYCIFCGDHVSVWPVDAFTSPTIGVLHREVYAHTDQCAMQYLAGMIDAVEPGTRRVPAQLRMGGDEREISFEEARRSA